MAKLRILFIGGSGVISSACSRAAVEADLELYVLNRGQAPARGSRPESRDCKLIYGNQAPFGRL